MDRDRYRLIQWATGQCGRMAVRAIARRPDLELVGTRVFTADKVGVDVGELCEIEPLGVVASDREEELLALDADCVLWMGAVPIEADGGVPELCRILASGKNVVSIVHTLCMAPSHRPIEVREPLEAACAAGG